MALMAKKRKLIAFIFVLFFNCFFFKSLLFLIIHIQISYLILDGQPSV